MEESAVRLREALLIKPDFLPAMLNLAEVLNRSGRAAEAARWYRAVLDREPNNSAARGGLERARAATSPR
jgi:TolA-binding protein